MHNYGGYEVVPRIPFPKRQIDVCDIQTTFAKMT